MEKYMKNLSIVFMLMTTMFFLSMFGYKISDESNAPQFVLDVLLFGAQTFLFLVPLMYMVIFGISMTSLFKRVLNIQNRMVQKSSDKFPLLWLILSTVSFMGYFAFVNLVFSAE
jgi:hypothetical protein